MTVTKAASQKKRERAYQSGVRVYRSSAHHSGVCLCRSMVGADGGIADVPTFVVSVQTASSDIRTIFCEECAVTVVSRFIELAQEIVNEQHSNDS